MTNKHSGDFQRLVAVAAEEEEDEESLPLTPGGACPGRKWRLEPEWVRTSSRKRSFWLAVWLSLLLIGLFVWSERRFKESSSFKSFNRLAEVNDRKQRNASEVSRNNLKILCFVLTNVETGQKKIEAIERTWGRRCDKLLFVERGQSRETEETPDGRLLVPISHESREMLWRKVILATLFLYANYLDQFHWFFKTDDDTFLLVDELKHFLSQRSSPEEAVYFGHKFKPYVKQGYMSGGSGYALSRRALKLLVEVGFTGRKPEECKLLSGSVEDIEIGACLELSGVSAGDSRDFDGRETFLPLSADFLSNKTGHLTSDFWYWNYTFYEESLGNCCSRRPISLHYVNPETMYLIEWLLYEVVRV